MAITLSVIVLAGAALLIGMTLSGDRTPPGHTRGPSVGATEPAGPTATVTVTVFATPLAAPPAAAADGGGVDGTAWIAAVGAIIAGFGTLASGAAAMAALRRSGGKEHRPVHHRSDGRSRRSQW
jgi:hypothetical protein